MKTLSLGCMCDLDTFQGCPCPMQSCPKNADTGALIGNGKGAPVAQQGPGLSLPPSALVGPPSPARGLAGLAPPHGANAWDTDRVQRSGSASASSGAANQKTRKQPAPVTQAPSSSSSVLNPAVASSQHMATQLTASTECKVGIAIPCTMKIPIG